MNPGVPSSWSLTRKGWMALRFSPYTVVTKSGVSRDGCPIEIMPASAVVSVDGATHESIFWSVQCWASWSAPYYRFGLKIISEEDRNVLTVGSDEVASGDGMWQYFMCAPLLLRDVNMRPHTEHGGSWNFSAETFPRTNFCSEGAHNWTMVFVSAVHSVFWLIAAAIIGSATLGDWGMSWLATVDWIASETLREIWVTNEVPHFTRGQSTSFQYYLIHTKAKYLILVLHHHTKTS